MGTPAARELEYAETKIGQNFSNYSAWHSRTTLLPVLHGAGSSGGDAAGALASALESGVRLEEGGGSEAGAPAPAGGQQAGGERPGGRAPAAAGSAAATAAVPKEALDAGGPLTSLRPRTKPTNAGSRLCPCAVLLPQRANCMCLPCGRLLPSAECELVQQACFSRMQIVCRPALALCWPSCRVRAGAASFLHRTRGPERLVLPPLAAGCARRLCPAPPPALCLQLEPGCRALHSRCSRREAAQCLALLAARLQF